MNSSENKLFKKDAWLINAEVQFKVEKIKGQWLVSLVFINTKNPRCFIIRKISSYRSENLAKLCANYILQNASKDLRGTQKVSKYDYNFNNN